MKKEHILVLSPAALFRTEGRWPPADLHGALKRGEEVAETIDALRAEIATVNAARERDIVALSANVEHARGSAERRGARLAEAVAELEHLRVEWAMDKTEIERLRAELGHNIDRRGEACKERDALAAKLQATAVVSKARQDACDSLNARLSEAVAVRDSRGAEIARLVQELRKANATIDENARRRLVPGVGITIAEDQAPRPTVGGLLQRMNADLADRERTVADRINGDTAKALAETREALVEAREKCRELDKQRAEAEISAKQWEERCKLAPRRWYVSIADEMAAQDEKWGAGRDMPDVARDHLAACSVRVDTAQLACERAAEAGRLTWGHILLEEVCEAFDAALHRDPIDLQGELVQVAAVCMQWAGAIRRRYTTLGTDGAAWAAAFCTQHPDVDRGAAIGWFANAIEAGKAAGAQESK